MSAIKWNRTNCQNKKLFLGRAICRMWEGNFKLLPSPYVTLLVVSDSLLAIVNLSRIAQMFRTGFEPRGNNSTGLKGLYLKVQARIWPSLSFMCCVRQVQKCGRACQPCASLSLSVSLCLCLCLCLFLSGRACQPCASTPPLSLSLCLVGGVYPGFLLLGGAGSRGSRRGLRLRRRHHRLVHSRLE